MSAVHHVFNTRTARYLREYTRTIDAAYEKHHNRSALLPIANDFARKGKIKRERAGPIRDNYVSNITSMFSANQILRFDDLITGSKLSSHFEPVTTVISYLQPTQIIRTVNDAPSYINDALLVSVATLELRKDRAVTIEANTGIQIGFHALARLQERQISTNPIEGIAEHLNTILLFSALYIILAGRLDFFGCAIPFGNHMMLAELGQMKVTESEPALSGIIMSRAGPEQYKENFGNESIRSIDIRTVVDYDIMSNEQDHLNQVLIEFAETHIEEINLMFEAIFMTPVHKADKSSMKQAVERLVSNFRPISQMQEFKRLSKIS